MSTASKIVFGIARVFVVGLVVASIWYCSACSNLEYSVVNKVFYSDGADMDWAYGDQRKEFTVGQNCYMKVKMTALATKKSGNNKIIAVKITIPKIEGVDAYYLDGAKIVPESDEVNNITVYNFSIVAHEEKKAKDFEIVIQYVPNTVGSITMTIEYGEQVPDAYDYQSTVNFIAPIGD